MCEVGDGKVGEAFKCLQCANPATTLPYVFKYVLKYDFYIFL